MATNADRLVLHQLQGAILIDAVVTNHVFPGRENHPVNYYLSFDPVGWLEIRGDSAGWGLTVTLGEAPTGFDMDRYGKVTASSVRGTTPFLEAVGRAFSQADLIVVPTSEVPIGLRLTFGDYGFLIYNWGDELFVGQELPEYLSAVSARIEPLA